MTVRARYARLPLRLLGLSASTVLFVVVAAGCRTRAPSRPEGEILFPHAKHVAEAAKRRFRPILLTSITTVAGLLPMAYGIGGADPFSAPMALAMGYGILFATPLTLVLLPCLLTIHDDILRLSARVFRRGAKSRT